jgi:hypothetical protein
MARKIALIGGVSTPLVIHSANPVSATWPYLTWLSSAPMLSPHLLLSFLIAHWTSRNFGNASFFLANKNAP